VQVVEFMQVTFHVRDEKWPPQGGGVGSKHGIGNKGPVWSATHPSIVCAGREMICKNHAIELEN